MSSGSSRPQPTSIARSGQQISDVTPVLNRMRTLIPTMPEALARVAEQVLADPSEATTLALVELAERSRVAPATVTRFCRSLGYKHYRELRIAVAAETGRAEQARWEVDLGKEIDPSDRPEHVLEVLAGSDSRVVQETASQLDLRVAVLVADLLARARRVDLFGTGSSYLSAAEMQNRLERIGVATWARCDVHSALVSAALLGAGDVAFCVSHSGDTVETIEVLKAARRTGAMTVALTSFENSPLAQAADLVLTTSARETTFRPEALSAKHSQLLVLDVVYVLVAQRTFDRTTRAFEAASHAVDKHKA